MAVNSKSVLLIDLSAVIILAMDLGFTQLWLMLIRCYKMALNSKSVLFIDLSATVLGFTQFYLRCYSMALIANDLVTMAVGGKRHGRAIPPGQVQAMERIHSVAANTVLAFALFCTTTGLRTFGRGHEILLQREGA
eukprot:gene2896-4956_t